MTVGRPSPPRWSIRRLTVPFLVLAYPATLLVYQGGQYCGPLCFAPTTTGVLGLAATVLVAGLVAVGVTAGLGLQRREPASPVRRWLVAPPRAAVAVLGAVYLLFVVFLTLDALGVAGSLWKPVVLPLSFVLFAPVWLLYALTFPLSVVLSVLGLGSSSVLTFAVRAVILGLGFPLAVGLQAVVASWVATRLGTGGA